MAIDEADVDTTCAWRRPASEVEVITPDGIEGSDGGSWRTIFIALGLVLLMVLGVLVFVGVAGASAPGGCGGG